MEGMKPLPTDWAMDTVRLAFMLANREPPSFTDHQTIARMLDMAYLRREQQALEVCRPATDGMQEALDYGICALEADLGISYTTFSTEMVGTAPTTRRNSLPAYRGPRMNFYPPPPQAPAAPPVLASDEEMAKKVIYAGCNNTLIDEWTVIEENLPEMAAVVTQYRESIIAAHRTAHQAAPVRSVEVEDALTWYQMIANDPMWKAPKQMGPHAKVLLAYITALEAPKATPDAVECAEAVWKAGNRHGPDADRKQTIANLITAYGAAVRVKALEEAALACERHNSPGVKSVSDACAADVRALKGKAAEGGV